MSEPQLIPLEAIPPSLRGRPRTGEYEILNKAYDSGEAIWLRSIPRQDIEKVDARYRQAAQVRGYKLSIQRHGTDDMVDLYITVDQLGGGE